MGDPLTIIHGDALSSLRQMESESVQTCVTSPPYWGLRDYGHEFQIGLEKTPEEYVTRLVETFSEVKRVLRGDGTLWLNLGDSYFGDSPARKASTEAFSKEWNPADSAGNGGLRRSAARSGSLKPKDLIGIPWRVAFALHADGWYLRSDIIWSKPNPMPESVTDRPTRSHEYIFLLSKSRKYFYDAEAIKEPSSMSPAEPDANASTITGGRYGRHVLAEAIPSKERRSDKQRGHSRRHAGFNDRWDAMEREQQCSGMRNKRSVWNVVTRPFPDAHFATFPEDLISPCILAGSPAGGIVLDLFAGSGTTGKVAIELGRKAILIEAKAEYVEMIERRCKTTIGLPLQVSAWTL